MDGGNPCLPAGKFDPSCLKPLKTGTHTEAVLLKLIAEIYLHGSWTGCLTTSDVFKVSIYKLYIYISNISNDYNLFSLYCMKL